MHYDETLGLLPKCVFCNNGRLWLQYEMDTKPDVWFFGLTKWVGHNCVGEVHPLEIPHIYVAKYVAAGIVSVLTDSGKITLVNDEWIYDNLD